MASHPGAEATGGMKLQMQITLYGKIVNNFSVEIADITYFPFIFPSNSLTRKTNSGKCRSAA